MTEELPSGYLDCRCAGILLHITSLPGSTETGDMGPEAYRLVDFLKDAGIRVWQMLPIGPTQADGSPYQSSSVHAGNPRLISIEPLAVEGWFSKNLPEKELITDSEKAKILRHAWADFQANAERAARLELEQFIERESYWLEDYALFRALQEEHEHDRWWEWPEELRSRHAKALTQARSRLSRALGFIRFEQFLFFRQWFSLKAYANDRGVMLFGDMPIFVAHNSAEVWAHQEMFLLDAEGHPQAVAGVPPDYFSATGQRWGNPLYHWKRMEEEGFSFWIDRMQTQPRLFDLIRIDHFRGFEAYWEIPAHEEHAIHGRWIEAPGDALFDRLHQSYDPLPLVAEDLGVITPEVDALRKRYGLPGMKVLQFAFSGDVANPYLPFQHETNSVVYTGTHDNDTTLGWYVSLEDDTRQYVDEFLGFSREVMPWPMIRAALASRSRMAIIPMQDLLGLDGSHRMNLPGTSENNWVWRFAWDQIEEDLAERLRRRIKMYGRLASSS